MNLIPLMDRTGTVKAWAEPQSGWVCNLKGSVFAVITFDAVFTMSGVQIGWWFGDHVRDRYGCVVLARLSTKIEGLNMPRREKVPRAPKIHLPSGHRMLRWLLTPPLKQHKWADLTSLFDDGLDRIRVFERKLQSSANISVWQKKS